MRVLRIRDPVPIQIGYDILNFPYQFEYNWTSVNNTFINFNQSYIELVISAEKETGTTTTSVYTSTAGVKSLTPEQFIKFNLPTLQQETNIYCMIDSVDVEMVYGLPDGTQRALKYHEPSIHTSLGRKMVILKETSKNELEKSCYGENLTNDAYDLSTLRYIRRNAGNEVTIAIPFNLICGLGTDADTLINVKHLKMFVRMAPLNLLFDNETKKITYPAGTQSAPTYAQKTGLAWFKGVKLCGVNMNLMTYHGVQFNSNELYKTIPSYVQIDYQYSKIVAKEFLVNRALPFLPEYILIWFTKGFKAKHVSNIPEPGIWPTYISCLVGNTQMFPQTEFPTQKYYNNIGDDGSITTSRDNTVIGCPNKLLYNLWADNSHPETMKNYDEWLRNPVFIIPCNALMDVRSNSGIELNMEMRIEVNVLQKILYKSTTNDGRIAKSFDSSTYPTVDSSKIVWASDGYDVAAHHGYFNLLKTDVSESEPLTLHMISVRTIRDM